MRASRYFSLPAGRVSARDEARFFNALRTGNATFKRTAAGRLAAIDRALVDWLVTHGKAPEHVLDLGISAGITTLELRNVLQAAGWDAAVTGTDRSLHAALLPLPFGCRALVEPDGHVLQYEVAGQAVRPWRRRLDYVTGIAPLGWAVDRALRGAAAARLASPDREPVALVSRAVATASDIRLVEDDITVPNPDLIGRFDLVRAANLLNRHYFSGTDLAAAVANTRSYLRGPGALLLVLRTHGEDDHRGTLFVQDERGRLDVALRWGGGSEIEPLLLG